MTSHTSPVSLVDLHTHSTASDGVNPPSEVVRLAAERGIRFLALTDHDSTEGLGEALSAASSTGIDLIAGVELGTDVAAGELHMLGYCIDHDQPELQSTLSAFRAARRDRAATIVQRLNTAGIDVTLDEVRGLAGAGAVSRAHVARVLIAHGIARSMDDAFARFLGRGQVGYVPRPRLTPPEAIRLIQGAGGVAVLAHPFTVDDLARTVSELVAAGLQGIEVYYGSYSESERQALLGLAERYSLIPTGGTDFHGFGEREGRDLGSVFVPVETVERLRRARELPPR